MSKDMLVDQLNKLTNNVGGYAWELAYMLIVRVAHSTLECGVLEDDPVKVWVVKPGSPKRTVMGFKKFCEFMHAQSPLTNFEELPAVSTKWGELFKVKNYTFEVVSGQDVVDAYINGPHSCMSGGENTKRIEFYIRNNVELVKIYEEGRFFGRALLWSGVRDDNGEPVKALDRVYPSDGGIHSRKVREWAFEQGWLVRNDDSAPGSFTAFHDGKNTVRVRWTPLNVSEGTGPYFDTFRRFAYHKGEFFFFSGRGGIYDVTGDSYFNSPEEAGWIRTDIRRRVAPVWEMNNTLDGFATSETLREMIDLGQGRWALPEHMVYCMYSGERVHLSETTRHTLNSGVTITVANKYIQRHPQAMPGDGVLLPFEWQEITSGIHRGFFTNALNVVSYREQQGFYCSERDLFGAFANSYSPSVKGVAIRIDRHDRVYDMWVEGVFHSFNTTRLRQITNRVWVDTRGLTFHLDLRDVDRLEYVWEEFADALRLEFPDYFKRSLHPEPSNTYQSTNETSDSLSAQ